uniref:C-Jun-amino-terminal kinase-interacting protein 4 n=1 Tax=Gadus morhua TaxID=8049 RepID=A0A8C5C5A8_GADMO
MELDDVVLYQDDSGASDMMSERVSGLASSIYQEFERLIGRYDEDVVKQLMPLVVAVLENLDSVFSINQEHEVELELLKEDNEQLVTQYEREKALRKHTEERYIVLEDSQDGEKKELQSRLVLLESHTRQMELKARNYADQINRLEEREAELKKEFTSLHQRHTEVCWKETHIVQISHNVLEDGFPKERPISGGIFPLPGTDSVTSDLQRDVPESPSQPWRFAGQSQPRCNASLVIIIILHALELVLVFCSFSSRSPPPPPPPPPPPRLSSPLSTPTKGIGGVENLALDRNTESLFEELSSCAGNDLIGDMDDGADLLGMGREVEHLIQENTQLLETKNALNVVKNDLIAQVDELACLREGLQSELEAVSQAKARVEDRNKELEEDLKKLRAELEEAKQKTKSDNGEDSDVPTAQRKRFTRVEMARVLMERNQYKERLMELQEAVRWAEMIRGEGFFSRLFSSSGGAGKKPAGDAPVNLKYNAPSAQVQPTVKKKSSALQQLPSDKSKAFDFLNEEAAADPAVSRREQKRAQYQQVKDHVQKEDGRVQAYGWSLPHKYKVANGGQSETKMRNLPIPVFLRPLDEKNTSMKLWCAAGVNLSGGKTRDGGSIVGASVFYSSAPGPPPPRRRTGSQSSLDKLDQELEQEELRQTDEFSSLVWICTSTQSSTQSSTRALVIDANQPGHVLDNFPVCDSHVVCIASVPGARETDYPAGELVPLNSEAGPVEDNGSASLNASTNSVGENGEGVLGGITVVGCDAEGAAAIRQTAGSTAETSGDEDTRPIEEAGEASESCTGPSGRSKGPRGAYTEHIFADPLGAQKTDLPAGYTQRETDLVKDGLGPSAGPTGEEEQDLKLMEEAQKMTSVLPTMWLGAQNGCVYVHSSVARWKKCLHWIKLKDAVQGIVHVKGRVLVGLSDGTLAIFQRGADGQWDLSNYHLLDLGRPHHAVRCMAVVHDRVWCGLSNKIYVVQPEAMRVEKSFDAHPRKESQVRQLARDGDGIWVSIRLDSTLRLFHAHTHQHLQDVDIEPYVSKMLGTGKLGFSFVRITALMVSCNRLWIGTGNGVIMSVPLTETSEANQALVPAGAGQQQPTGGAVVRVYGDAASDKVTAGTFVPYCSMANAQLCFHGHRDAVKFFTAVPGTAEPGVELGGAAGGGADGPSQDGPGSMLVMSGGEGYIDFRMGDVAEEGEEPRLTLQPLQASAESSHLIVWQVLPHST